MKCNPRSARKGSPAPAGAQGCARPPLPGLPCPAQMEMDQNSPDSPDITAAKTLMTFFLFFFLSPTSPWEEVDNELCILHWHSYWGEIINCNSTSSLPIFLGGWNNGDAYIFFSTSLRKKVNQPLSICFSWKRYVWIN